MNNVIEFERRYPTSIDDGALFIDQVKYRPSPEVAKKVYSGIQRLGNLQENWDGMSAKSPTENAIHGAIRWVGELFRSDTPAPDVFPVPNGNIQIEWSCCELDLEIEIESISTCYVSYEDYRRGNEENWERKFVYDIGKLSTVIDLLSFRYTEEREGHLLGNAG